MSSIPATEYGRIEYWQARLTSEKHHEWLASSSEFMQILTTVVSTELSDTPKPLDILHIGCGTSDLSFELQELVPAGAADRIVNVDFSSLAVERGRSRELEMLQEKNAGLSDPAARMRWEEVDLLDWDAVRSRLSLLEGRGYQLIVEKSCSDALSCAEDVPLHRSLSSPEMLQDYHAVPSLSIYGGAANGLASNKLLLPPTVILCLHMAALTAPGAVWVALSYSASRFDFLQTSTVGAQRLWKLERTEQIPAERGVKRSNTEDSTVHRPDIFHTVYILRRTGVSIFATDTRTQA